METIVQPFGVPHNASGLYSCSGGVSSADVIPTMCPLFRKSEPLDDGGQMGYIDLAESPNVPS